MQISVLSEKSRTTDHTCIATQAEVNNVKIVPLFLKGILNNVLLLYEVSLFRRGF